MAKPPKPHEHAYYSAGRWLLGQAYIVGWPIEGIVKAGYTSVGRRRYGAFLSRGADLLYLEAFPALGAFDAEKRLGDAMGARWPSAFANKEEAAPYLGSRGAGYLECYRIPVEDWQDVIDLSRGG